MIPLTGTRLQVTNAVKSSVRYSADVAVDKNLIEVQGRALKIAHWPEIVLCINAGRYFRVHVREMLLSSCELHVNQHNSTLRP